MYLCECGRSFDNKYSRASHRRYCDVYNHGVSSYKKKMINMMRNLNKELWQNPEFREFQSEKMKKQFDDPKFREKVSQAVKESWQNPKFREKVSKAAKELWQNPEYRKSHEIMMRNLWDDPNFREKVSQAISNSDKDNFNKILNRYLSSYKGDMNSKCYVYFVRLKNSLKIGFCCSLKRRFRELHAEELINLIIFDNIEKGLRYEYEFHQSHKNLMISNEYYPLEFLDRFNKEFINYNRKAQNESSLF